MVSVPPIGSEVELRPHLDEFYDAARAGWRGVVVDHKVDDEGFDLIYVEWLLRAAGQPDGWTYPAHFEVIREGWAEDAEVCEDCGEVHDAKAEQVAYLEYLKEAIEGAVDGEGFALFFVKRRTDDTGTYLTPSVFSSALTDEAEALISSKVVMAAQMVIERLIEDNLRQYMDPQ